MRRPEGRKTEMDISPGCSTHHVRDETPQQEATYSGGFALWNIAAHTEVGDAYNFANVAAVNEGSAWARTVVRQAQLVRQTQSDLNNIALAVFKEEAWMGSGSTYSYTGRKTDSGGTAQILVARVWVSLTNAFDPSRKGRNS